MSNNDILRSLRYTFDLNDFLVIEIFGMAGVEVDRPTVASWLKKDDDEEFKPIYDKDLSAFLNGFIVFKRGKKEGQEIVNEKSLSNNQVLRKIKIALSLIDEDMLTMLKAAELLKERELNVTQVSYEIGISSLSNFAKTFKEKFGVNPSEYH